MPTEMISAGTILASLEMKLKSFVFYPSLFGLEQQTPAQQAHIIDEAVALFLARYQVK